MTTEPVWYSVPDLIGVAAGSGYTITPRQIERWRKAGLLPQRREQQHVPGTRGSIGDGAYPPFTDVTLLALLRLKQEHKHLTKVAFWMLWEGVLAKPGTVRRTLRTLMPWSADVRETRRQGTKVLGPEKAARRAAVKYGPGDRHPVTRWLRQQFGSDTSDPDGEKSLGAFDEEDRIRALTLLLTVGYGAVPLLSRNADPDTGDRSDSDLLRTVLGLPGPRSVRGFPHVDGPAATLEAATEQLRAAEFSYAALHAAVDRASYLQLRQAVQDAKLWLDVLPRVLVRAARNRTPQGQPLSFVFGRAYRRLLRYLRDIPSRATAIAIWLMVRSAFGDKELDQLHEIADGLSKDLPAAGPNRIPRRGLPRRIPPGGALAPVSPRHPVHPQPALPTSPTTAVRRLPGSAPRGRGRLRGERGRFVSPRQQGGP